jgi:hypothetical protein
MSEINSLRSESDISFSQSNSDEDAYYLEDDIDSIFYRNINFEKLKKIWTFINNEICIKLNKDYLPIFKEFYFIALPISYKLRIELRIGRKDKLSADPDYVYCDNLMSTFSLIITSGHNAEIGKFKLFHLSFHSMRPKAIEDKTFAKSGLRKNKRNIICTRYPKRPEDVLAVKAAKATEATAAAAAIEEARSGGIHIKIDNLVYLAAFDPSKDIRIHVNTPFKRITFDDETQQLKYLTDNFSKNMDIQRYVDKYLEAAMIKHQLDLVLKNLVVPIN